MKTSATPKPSKLYVAVDVLIFSIINDQLQVLLIRRDAEPCLGSWAIPGGLLHEDESLETSAKRQLLDKTGVDDIYLEQLYSFGELKRDPRERSISVTYFSLVSSSKISKKDINSENRKTKWFEVNKLPHLAFDHKDIVDYATQRIRWKLEYTNIVFSLLEAEFTLADLQNIYQIVFAKDFDKRNFRKKILSLNILEPTGKSVLRGAHRPAKSYRFLRRKFSLIEMS